LATSRSEKSRPAAPAASRGKSGASARPSAAGKLPRAASSAAAKSPRKSTATKAVKKAAATKTVSAGKPAASRNSRPAPGSARKAAVTQSPAKAPRKRAVVPAVPADPIERLRQVVRHALDELKARDISEIDVRGKTSIADYLVVASGTSTRHVKSIADEVVKSAKKSGVMPLGVEGVRQAEWVLVDLGDIVVHVMLPRVREFYGLERLWSVSEERREAAAD